jgi:DNA repair protein RecN (Recombination protein N)
MLLHLSIHDFAIVDTLELDFELGFTALTGETGAGKSILIDALALALGERADADAVRPGAERADVVAEFAVEPGTSIARWLEEQALEGDPGRLVLRRVVDKGGRSRAFINGRVATVQQLRDASDSLVDIHGQHAHQSLLRRDAQRALLDEHAGLTPLVSAVAQAYRDWSNAQREREASERDSAARDAERGELAWRVQELDRLAPREREWETLGDEHTRLAHAASLVEGAQAALDVLTEAEGAAATTVSGVASRLRSLVQFDARLGEIVAMLDSATAQLQEAGYALRHYGSRVELDPARLAEVEARVDALHGMARRLRVAPGELAAFAEASRAQLAALDVASDPEALRMRESVARERYAELARELSDKRRVAAARLAADVSAAMKELAMGGGRFEIAMEPIEGGSAAGDEQVEFLVATNPGMPLRPLAKVASGGELSRLSLAIQVITSRAAQVPTMIFDEVDAGIGGAVAEVVGRKMKALGTDRQVLCVTHLPQVAAQADQQWTVAKVTSRGGVQSRVTVLDDAGRIEEIARMLGGAEITPTTRSHAAELIESARASRATPASRRRRGGTA